jgi:hypothetical protein
MAQEPNNLEQMLDRIDAAVEDGGQVSMGAITEAVGRRSFGALLLLAGTVLASPLSGIPGIPTSMGVLVLLIAAQLLFARQCCWLPQWLLKRSVSRSRLDKMLQWLRPPARWIDRCLRPRLPLLVNGASTSVIAGVCILFAAAIPAMEVVPFSATVAGIALAVFGLSLVAHDGLLALLAFALAAATLGFVAYRLLH